MAALQTVRNRGKILVIVVALALFAFIAEEFVRSLTYTQTESRQRVGSVNGNKISIQEFNDLVDEYTDVIKYSNGLNNLSDEQMQSIRDQVWNTYINNQIIEEECNKLGLTVTDKELQNIIATGASPLLAQTPFRTQQGGFDAEALKQFLTQYQELMTNTEIPAESKEQATMVYKYWKFVEKQIRQQTLIEKYQSLLASCIISNPVAAKQNFEGSINESDILLAAVPYSSVKDGDIQVDDKELQAKYNELKELFRNPQETRDIKYISVPVTASKADEKAINEEMDGYAAALAAGEDAAKVVREAGSMVSYSTLPISKRALPLDIAAQLDSLSEGQQVGPYYNKMDNTSNIIRLIATESRPDSVEIRQISVPGVDMAAAQKTADSIMTALQAGANFDTIAKKYNQPATKQWITSNMFEGQTLDQNNRKFIDVVTTSAVGSVQKVEFDGTGVIICNILDRKNFQTKYNVAVIKRTIDFSKDTYNKAFNDFSSFLAGKKATDIEAEAMKAGYNLQVRENVSNAEHTVANVASTREAMRWIFNDDTEVGDVSPLYECGNNDNLLCVILTGVHKKGYLAWNENENIKEFLKSEVIKDKKAAQLQEKLAGAKSIADVMKIAGAVSDTIKHVTFSNDAYIAKVGASEPAISGSVSAAKKGDFRTAIRGNMGVYAFQVLNQDKQKDAKFDQKAQETQDSQMAMRGLGNFMQDLIMKADIKDNRYMFY